MNRNLLSAGARIALRNKRYVVWFYLLNLLAAWLGVSAFSAAVHAILDHSLYADKLLHGFDGLVLIELLGRPELGSLQSSTRPAILFAIVFLATNILFMPGVLLGYASDHRISQPEFYRACGSNVWRFVRLALVFVVVSGIIGGSLLAAQTALVDAAEKSSYERLPVLLQIGGASAVLLILTLVRIWFDLAQIDIVVRDEGKVRKAIVGALRSTRHNLGRLSVSYIMIVVMAGAVLAGGISLWEVAVPAASVLGGFIVSQAILILLLSMRFWQRATAVAYYVQKMTEPKKETWPATMVRAELGAASSAGGR